MRRYLCWLLILSLTGLQDASAQNASHDWSALSILRRGDTVVVERKSAPSLQDTFESFDETQINLAGRTVSRQDIQKIRLIGGRPFGNSIAIGIAIGSGAGALIGAIGGGCGGNGWCFVSRGATALVGAVLGVAFGAIAGTVIGATRHSHKLIYESRSTTMNGSSRRFLHL